MNRLGHILREVKILCKFLTYHHSISKITREAGEKKLTEWGEGGCSRKLVKDSIEYRRIERVFLTFFFFFGGGGGKPTQAHIFKRMTNEKCFLHICVLGSLDRCS